MLRFTKTEVDGRQSIAIHDDEDDIFLGHIIFHYGYIGFTGVRSQRIISLAEMEEILNYMKGLSPN